MKSTRWKVFGVETDTRVAEFKIENPDDQLMTYEEAKASALQRLKDHVAPYLARIEELEQDVFAETGALPPLRAWKRSYGSNAVITAKTKKRAAELAEESLYGFNIGWDACEGDWWYHLAREEAVWIEEQDDQKQGTGVFYKPLAREEAEQIVEQTIFALSHDEYRCASRPGGANLNGDWGQFPRYTVQDHDQGGTRRIRGGGDLCASANR